MPGEGLSRGRNDADIEDSPGASARGVADVDTGQTRDRSGGRVGD